MKKAIYISYDLGLKGDYNGLYGWLDALGARECGSGLALIEKEFKTNNHEEIYADIKKEIGTNVGLETNDRIYVILRAADGMLKGKFLYGGRKKAPWTGFAASDDDSEDSI
jgi:hypothetical protein